VLTNEINFQILRMADVALSSSYQGVFSRIARQRSGYWISVRFGRYPTFTVDI